AAVGGYSPDPYRRFAVIVVKWRSKHRPAHSESRKTGDATHRKAWQDASSGRFGSQLRVVGPAGAGRECIVGEVAQIFLPHPRRPGQTAPLTSRRLPDRIAPPPRRGNAAGNALNTTGVGW